jgi:hypothetical protein
MPPVRGQIGGNIRSALACTGKILDIVDGAAHAVLSSEEV